MASLSVIDPPTPRKIAFEKQQKIDQFQPGSFAQQRNQAVLCSYALM